jgi:hypothetical protein
VDFQTNCVKCPAASENPPDLKLKSLRSWPQRSMEDVALVDPATKFSPVGAPCINISQIMRKV